MSARIFISAVLVFALSACASLPEERNTPAQINSPSTGLSARTLGAGDCGLFVWAADADKEFILFGQSQNARANWLSPAGETVLSAGTQLGQPAQGQYPKQSYQIGESSTLTLDLREPQAIEDGTRYRAGTLTLTDENGWARVTPIVGLSACKPNANSQS